MTEHIVFGTALISEGLYLERPSVWIWGLENRIS